MIRRRKLLAAGLAAPAILRATRALSCTCSGGTGPAANSSFVTADFTSPYFYPTPGTQTQNPGRGQMVISPRLYGVVDGAGSNDGTEIGSFTDTTNGNPFALMTSPTYQSRMATVSPGLWAFITMPETTIWTTNIWVNPTSNPTLQPNAFTNLINNFYLLDPLQVSGIIIGLNWYSSADNRAHIMSEANYGAAIHVLANFFQNKLMPNGKRCPVIGFTGQNEPSNGDDINGFYSQIIANCKNVTLPGGGTYIVSAAVFNSVFPSTGSWNSLSAAVSGIDIFQWDNFFEGSATPGGVPMSTLQTVQASGGVADYFSDGIMTQVSNTVTYQPPLGYAPAGNMDSSVADIAQADFRGAMWDAECRIRSANSSPQTAINMKWDSALQCNSGFLADPSPTACPSPATTNNQITPAGYYNGRAIRTSTGPRWNVPTNSGNLLAMACTPGSDMTLKLVNAGQGTQTNKTIAFSHWPLNSSGNGVLNMWQLTSSTTADGTRTTINVGANAGQAPGVSQPVTLPDPSITIFSSVS